ncbi:hypothetical protein, partial [Burkholderia cenocepacia]|uniref:hypothetical protein n=1 Tax=Burkholderia cenocepacia TaxID=95486 RepID=UPI002232B744
LLNHLKSTRESESGILMGVHPAGFLEGWVFGDFQSPRLSPDEPSIQPIDASQLARRRVFAHCDNLPGGRPFLNMYCLCMFNGERT